MRPWTMGVFLAAAACSGPRFTAASADDAGGDDGGGDGAQSTDAPSDSAGGVPCTWAAPGGCPQNQYCDAPGCGSGVCRTVTKTSLADLKPVCGCDHQTYWNEGVARTHAMSVLASAECGAGARACTSAQQCANGASCNLHVTPGQCAASNASGVCWALPDPCPSGGLSPKTRECLATQCAGECDLIRNNKPWTDDNICP